MATPSANSVNAPAPSSNGTLTDEFIYGLVEGSAWTFGGGPRLLTYAFSLGDGLIVETGPYAWSQALREGFAQASATWASVANISLVESGSGTVLTASGADIAVTLTGSELVTDTGAAALGIFPSPPFADQLLAGGGMTRLQYPKPEGDIFFDHFLPAFSFLSAGGLGLEIMIHELGHALGLKHPGDNGGSGTPTFADLGIAQFDAARYTLMSAYLAQGGNSSFGHAATPMPLDILAIQQIYGPNTTYRTGNDLYTPLAAAMTTIWDAGGIDTIDASGYFGATIDLRPGAIMEFGPGTVLAVAYDNFLPGIALVENAIGGAGNDTIYGNDAGNILNGGAGDDTMYGGPGNDTYFIDSPPDAIVENAGQGTDTVMVPFTYGLDQPGRLDLENVTLTGTADVNATGNHLGNVLTGNSGANVLHGQSGIDTMIGGAGNDSYIVWDSGDLIIENPGEGSDSVQSTVSFILPAEVENLTLQEGYASINGTGNAAANAITGNSSANVLDGGPGADALIGGGGADTYVVDNPGDAITESADTFTDLVRSSVTYGLGPDLENLTLTGSAAIDGSGNSGDNLLTGNEAANQLAGGAGVDTLLGAGGTDLLDGGQGFDWMQGGPGADSYVVDTAVPAYALVMHGEPGDYVSGGRVHFYTSATGSFSATEMYDLTGDGLVDYLTLRYEEPGFSHVWSLTFSTDDLGQNLAAGDYTGAQRAAFAQAGHPGLDVFGDGRGSNQIFGSFSIQDAEFDYAGSSPTLRSFAATFELHSESAGAPALNGSIGFNYESGAAETVVEFANEGTDTVRSFVSMALPANVENLALIGSADVNATGNELDNVLAGNSGNNVLDGGSGADTAQYASLYRQQLLTGNPAGTATLQGPEGADTLNLVEKLLFVDGSLNFDPHSHAAQIERLYEAALGHQGGAQTFNYFISRLDSGVALGTIAQEFADSLEFQNRYVGLNTSQFVDKLFLNILDRHAGAGALSYWTGYLNSGGSRGQMLLAFSESPEFILRNAPVVDAGLWDIDETAGSVARLYLGLLGQVTDAAGLGTKVAGIKAGQLTLAQAAQEIAGSQAFSDLYGSLSDAQFVDRLFLNTQGHAGAPADHATWDAYLTGHTRGEAAIAFTEAAAFQLRTIGQMDQGIAIPNLLQGAAGDDTLAGGAMGETLVGLAGEDTLDGGAGNDSLTGGAGNDSLNGGAGIDSAEYSGLWRQQLLTGNPAGTATLQGPEGTDALNGVEKLQFVDGSLNFDPHSHAAQIQRLYEAAVARQGGAQTFNYFISRLDDGTGLRTIAQEFADSLEFQNRYAGLTTSQFVDKLFLNILDRHPGAVELGYWSGYLDSGGARGQVLLAFSESPEFILRNAPAVSAGLWDIDETAGSVARLYLGLLGQVSDVAGLGAKVAAIKAGQLTLAQAAQEIAGSQAFGDLYGSLSDAQFVDRLFLNTQGHAGSPADHATWDAYLTGHTRGEATIAFTEAFDYLLRTIGQVDQGIAIPNLLQGAAGDDTLTGSAMGETLVGLGGDDTLNGSGGNDTLLGGAGNDTLSGGAGTDMAEFAGLYRQHLLTGNPAGTATLQGPEGTDTLNSVETLTFVDGSLNFDPRSHAAQVERLYEAALARQGGAQTFNYFISRLDNGTGLRTLAQEFADSLEFQNRYVGLNTSQFVDKFFLNILDRHPGAVELNYWTGYLDSGGARGQMLLAFSESPEFILLNAPAVSAGLWDIDETAGSVARLYFGALGHAPTVANLVTDVAGIKGGQLTLTQEANALAASTEFVTSYGALNNTQFVDQLYLNLLQRTASPGEETSGLNLLDTGHTRGEVLLSLTDSVDYQLKLIGQIDHGIAALDAHFP